MARHLEDSHPIAAGQQRPLDRAADPCPPKSVNPQLLPQIAPKPSQNILQRLQTSINGCIYPNQQFAVFAGLLHHQKEQLPHPVPSPQ